MYTELIAIISYHYFNVAQWQCGNQLNLSEMQEGAKMLMHKFQFGKDRASNYNYPSWRPAPTLTWFAALVHLRRRQNWRVNKVGQTSAVFFFNFFNLTNSICDPVIRQCTA